MAGVEIGRVRGIHLGDGKVEVELKLHRGARVKTYSKASIKFIGLLGQNYVNVDFGSPNAPLVAPDAVLETVEQADLNTLMVKLEGVASGVEGLTKNFSGENFSNLLGPFTDFLKSSQAFCLVVSSTVFAFSVASSSSRASSASSISQI